MAKKYPESGEATKDEIIEIIDSPKIPRIQLAELLNVSNSTLHSWITKREMPYNQYLRILEIAKSGTTTGYGFVKSFEAIEKKQLLERYSLEELIAEIERRGFWVNMERKKS